jgi:hypothetical protein
VRKLLIGKELAKHSFLKSAEGYENRGVIFSLFLQKIERVKQEGERKSRGAPAQPRQISPIEAIGRRNVEDLESKIGTRKGVVRGKHEEW